MSVLARQMRQNLHVGFEPKMSGNGWCISYAALARGRGTCRRFLFRLVVILLSACWTHAQTGGLPTRAREGTPESDYSSSQPPFAAQKDAHGSAESAPTSMSLKKVFLNLPGDQKAIWTSPFHLGL